MYNRKPLNLAVSLRLARQAYYSAVAARDAYAEQLNETLEQLTALRAEFNELRAAVLARHHADQELALLYRERAIQQAKAVERDASTSLH